MEDKDKIIQEQEEEIKNLKRKLQIMQIRNESFEKKMKQTHEEDLSNTPWAQNLFDILDKTKQEYDELIEELKQYKAQYQEQIEQIHSLKERYIQAMDEVQEENKEI